MAAPAANTGATHAKPIPTAELLREDRPTNTFISRTAPPINRYWACRAEVYSGAESGQSCT
jgi:hypothetical protein